MEGGVERSARPTKTVEIGGASLSLDATPHFMSQTNQASLRRVKFYDRLARWVVTLGGAVVIVSVLGILVLIVATALPLFYPAACPAAGRGEVARRASSPKACSALGIQSAADDSVGWLPTSLMRRASYGSSISAAKW